MTARPSDVRSIQQALHDLGWPIAVDGALGDQTHRAVADFQHGWTPTNLVVDGFAGPITCDALNFSLSIGGHASPHFTYREFSSKGNGWIKVNRTLLRALEKLRAAHYPAGLTIVSGYRDPAYNRSLDAAASNSQHQYGAAADVPVRIPLASVRRLGVFSGIGYVKATGLVLHVDVRGQDGAPATTPGTPSSPSLWTY